MGMSEKVRSHYPSDFCLLRSLLDNPFYLGFTEMPACLFFAASSAARDKNGSIGLGPIAKGKELFIHLFFQSHMTLLLAFAIDGYNPCTVRTWIKSFPRSEER